LAQVVRLGRLVDQLFDLSTLESGAVPMAHQTVDLLAVAQSVAESARMRDGDAAVVVSADTSPDTSSGSELTVQGDPERLHQVLTNLVDNALRYAANGQDPVRIELLGASDSVELRVIDSGPGIPHGLRSRVFDRFVRGDTSRSSADGGAGLGLSIVKTIVDAHHGSIWIEDPVRVQSNSAPPGFCPGCCIAVQLPR
jgi:signal transduction histidine kinase